MKESTIALQNLKSSTVKISDLHGTSRTISSGNVVMIGFNDGSFIMLKNSIWVEAVWNPVTYKMDLLETISS